MYSYLVLIHLLGASVWAGGHIILSIVILPRAIKNHSIAELLQFESAFEKIGIPSLILQIITGFWLAHIKVPDFLLWFNWSDPDGHLVLVKITLLFLTVVIAMDARIRLIPVMSVQRLHSLAIHIISVTLIAILFVITGVSFRTGGWF